MRPAGAALVILGFLGLIFGGIHYNRRETVAQIGDLKMQATEKHTLGVPPVVCGIAILVGTVLWLRAGHSPSN